MTGSPRLIDAVTGVQADLHDMLFAIPVLAINIEHSNAQHAAIVDAVLAGDPGRRPAGDGRSLRRHRRAAAGLLMTMTRTGREER